MKKLCLLALAAIGLFSCDKGPEYKASPSMMNLTEGDVFKITITPAPNADYPVEFMSADPSVASVSSNGTVTAVSKGNTTIKAHCDKTKFSHEVTVTVSDIVYQLSPSSFSIQTGQTQQITILPAPPSGAFEFTSNDTNIAKVSSTGLVTAKAIGTASITARYAAKDQTLTSTITVTAQNYSLNYTSGAMWPGDTVRLVISPTPTGSFTFSSSNAAVATVNAAGLVTGVAPGLATITANVGGAPLTCSLEIKTVVPPFLEPLLTWALDSNAVKSQETHPFLGSGLGATSYALWFGKSVRDSFLTGLQYVWAAADPAKVFYINAYVPLGNLGDAFAYYKRNWVLKGLSSQNNFVFYNTAGTVAVIISQTPDEDGDIFCQFQKITPASSPKSINDFKVIPFEKKKRL